MKAKQQPKQAKKKQEKKQEDLSLEDRELKQKIDGHCERLTNSQFSSLKELTQIVKSATRTMTSVPKPFKFLKGHYAALKDHFEVVPDGTVKQDYADFMSVLSMIFGEKGARMSLFYLLKGTKNDFTVWGHEYVSNLASDIGSEYELRLENDEPCGQLLDMVDKISPYFIKNNAEHDTIDLLLIVDKLEDIKQFVTTTNFSKIHMYLCAVCGYSSDQDELVKILNILFEIALKLEEYTIALRVAIKLDEHDKIRQVFSECPDELIKKQLAFNAARQKIFIEDLSEEQTEILSNKRLSKFYLDLAKDLQVHEPKLPRDVFKKHLQQNYKGGSDSKAITLENIYVNGFVNAGLTKDTLMLDDQETKDKKSWVILLKDKEEWQIAAVASIGLLCPWNTSTIEDILMPFIDNEGKYVRAGACIGMGICSAGIYDENDIALGLLKDAAQNSRDDIVRQCSLLGLGMAYAGRAKPQILQDIIPTIVDTSVPIQESAFAALSLALTCVGQCNVDIAEAIISTLMERTDEQLNDHFAKYFGVALGLIFMGQQNKCQATLEALGIIEHPIKKFYEIIIISSAYVGSGNVLKVQNMIHQCLSDDKYTETAIIGLAQIASTEEVGNEMAMRLLNHILHFGKPQKKRIVPIAYAILSLSNPKINVMDVLFKLAYDTDVEVAHRAIISLGLVGAGTNNSRLAEIFRKLASYYNKQNETLFVIRIAQGFLYMGKGMLSLQPYYSERFLMSKVGMSGLLIFLVSLMDINVTLLGKYHYLMYFLSLAMYPKSLYVLNDKLEPMPLNVRVGQAVDIVGQAGNPKKITGFQTHTSPILIGNGQRAELAGEEYIPIQDCVLQNFVILRKNPDYVQEQRPRKKTSM